MAIFAHGNRQISYQTELAPFEADLLLLQGSRFDTRYWGGVLEDLATLPPAGGRIVTCDWSAGLSAAEHAADLARMVDGLGLQQLHIVAADDATAVAEELARLLPNVVQKSHLWPQGAPQGEALTREVRAFCPI